MIGHEEKSFASNPTTKPQRGDLAVVSSVPCHAAAAATADDEFALI